VALRRRRRIPPPKWFGFKEHGAHFCSTFLTGYSGAESHQAVVEFDTRVKPAGERARPARGIDEVSRTDLHSGIEDDAPLAGFPRNGIELAIPKQRDSALEGG
jgi:hypothetical protein